MALTLKAVLYSAVREDGTHSIAIRITIDRKIKYWPLGLTVAEKHWNEAATRDKSNWVRKSHDSAERYNRIIRGRLMEAEDLGDMLRQIEPISAQRLKEVLGIYEKRQDRDPMTVDRLRAILTNGIDGIHLTGFWWQFIRAATDSMQLTHEPQFRQFHRFFGRAGADGNPLHDDQGHFTHPILFREFTYERFIGWVHWLKVECNNTESTIQHKVIRLKSVLDEAVEQEIITSKLNPFRKWKPKTIIYEHEHLTLKEWTQLESVLPDLKPNSPIRHVLQLYRLQYYAHGMRIGDALRLKPQNLAGGRLRYRMGKNKKRIQSIELHDKLRQIIVEYLELRQTSQWDGSVYLFPFLKNDVDRLPYRQRIEDIRTATASVNNYLKKIAKLAKLEKRLTTHVARHTFSNNALQYRMDDGTKPFDIYDVSKAMGHGSVSLTQDIYGDRYQEEEGDIIDRMFYQTKGKTDDLDSGLTQHDLNFE